MIQEVKRLAQLAGEAIMEVRASNNLGSRAKADDSVVTEADLRANAIIMEGLEKISKAPIISEEAEETHTRQSSSGQKFWLVDPLDGTRDFVAGKDTFVVSIGLIERGRPVLGVIYAPALNEMFWAETKQGAYLNGVKIRNRSQRKELVAVASGSHSSPRVQAFLDRFHVKEVKRYGSALKICRMAQGEADLYPRFGQTSEWDTAAAHIIANEAGCKILDLQTKGDLRYGKPGFINRGFLACRYDLEHIIHELQGSEAK